MFGTKEGKYWERIKYFILLSGTFDEDDYGIFQSSLVLDMLLVVDNTQERSHEAFAYSM
jgi:hypothetical protein